MPRRSVSHVALLCALGCGDPGAPAGETSGSSSTTSDLGTATSDTGTPTTGADTHIGSAESTGEPAPVALVGTVEGPFVAGTVTITPLTAAGTPAGPPLVAAIADGLGSFTVEDVPPGPIDVVAKGTYYDIFADAVAPVPLTLRALTTADGVQPIHVHALTHISEPRTRVLWLGGQSLASAADEVEGDASNFLKCGGTPKLARRAAHSSLAGPDDIDDAYVFLLTVLSERLDAEGSDIQATLDTLASDLGDDGVIEPELWPILPGVEYQLPEQQLRDRLSQYLADHGVPGGAPDLRRVFDPDHDFIPAIDDNCPAVANPSQFDSDQDDIGDACDCGINPCDCGFESPDQDGDHYPDACDNCPAVANPSPIQHEAGWPASDSDYDGFGDACDSCPYSPDKIDGSCCDPRSANCVKSHPLLDGVVVACQPSNGGVMFICETIHCDHVWGYGFKPECPFGPNAPPGALARVHQPSFIGDVDIADCDTITCESTWCTLGDPCGGAGNVCLAWHAPGQAPPGSETLGACARVDTGPCVGKFGFECLTW